MGHSTRKNKKRNNKKEKKTKKEKEKGKKQRPNWIELPRDVTAKILHNLGTVEIVRNARQVCSLWRNICKDPLMWRAIDMHGVGNSRSYFVICRYALDHSSGLLQDVNIEFFATDILLRYIADRASHIQSLRLFKCWAVSEEGLIEVVKKLPQLEEIDLSFCYISRRTLGVICYYCQRLKVLKINRAAYTCFENNTVAYAIANNMHELRHLQLLGNSLTNKGLLDILDGCPDLESLDLRTCFNVDLSGALGERCHKQIKKLLLPYDDLK